MVRRRQTRKPHFFKILLGDFERRLRIPPNFVKHISKDTPRRVFLHGPSGSIWRVELGETMKSTFLTNGWSKFVKDHCLKEHEFLVFRYDRNMRFSVQIFDKSACERQDAFSVKSSTAYPGCRGQRKKNRQVNQVSDDSSSLKDQGSKNEVIKEPEDGQLMISSQPIINVFVKTEEIELPIGSILSQRKMRNGRLSTRRPVTDEERENARIAANSFRSSFPYVIIRMTESHVYTKYALRFPVKFSRQHLPRERTNLILRDPNGMAWVVVYVAATRDRLSSGWFSFARGNKLEEGDHCIFELTSSAELRVHIFRVVDETTPAATVSEN